MNNSLTVKELQRIKACLSEESLAKLALTMNLSPLQIEKYFQATADRKGNVLLSDMGILFRAIELINEQNDDYELA